MNEEIKNDKNLKDEGKSEVIEETTDTEVAEELLEEEKFASLDEEFKSKMEAKVLEAEQKAKEAEDKFLRTHADFENLKKRLEKEKYSAIDYASEKFAKD